MSMRDGLGYRCIKRADRGLSIVVWKDMKMKQNYKECVNLAGFRRLVLKEGNLIAMLPYHYFKVVGKMVLETQNKMRY
jgi:hypothetical protein